MTKPKKTRGPLRRSSVIIILLSVCFVLTLPLSYINLNRSLYEERSTNLEMLMNQVAKNVDVSMQHQWRMIDHLAQSVLLDAPLDLSGLMQRLHSLNLTSDESVTRLFLIDKDSYCYQSDGKRFRWSNQAMLASGKQECQISTAEFYIEEGAPQMLFITPLDRRLTVDGTVFTHLGVAITMDFLDSFYQASSLGEGSISFILRPTGGQVYRYAQNHPLTEVHNLLSALENADFLWGESHERLVSAIHSRISGCMAVTFENQSYYLIYAPLSANDWMSVMMIPEDNVAVGARSFLVSIVMTILMLMLFAGSLVVTLVVVFNRKANQQLKQAANAEREANLAKTRFLSSMSHDIRTPMNAIVGMTALALEHKDDPLYVENSLQKVQMASGHLLTLINDVLDISKVESGKMTLNPSSFLLRQELKNLCNIFVPQAREKGQTFTFRSDGVDGIRIFADKLRLNQVMINLLSNAIKYTPEGGHILMEALGEERDGKLHFLFRVQDDGIGMSETFQRDMYHSFARERSETGAMAHGTGLGLTICKQMVELLGGDIHCQSSIGRGTTFTVTLDLPLAGDQEPQAGQNAKRRKLDKRELEGMRILLAEDNEFNWEIAREILGMHGILIDRAENGKRCVEMIQNAEEGLYQLILMDIQMPVMNGYEATQMIRASEREYLKTIPIIAMTADAFAEDVQHCMEVGMNAHIAKPIDPEKLLEVIMNHGA